MPPYGGIGFPRPTTASPFPTDSRGIPSGTGPRTVESPSHPLASFAPFPEPCSIRPATAPKRPRILPWGFASPSRSSPTSPTCKQVFHSLLAFPLLVFLPLSAVYSSSGRVDLFHSTAAYELHNRRDFPRQPAVRLIAERCPPVVTRAVPRFAEAPPPARCAPPPGRCSDYRSVVPCWRFRPTRNPIPSSVFNPAGFSLDASATPSCSLRSQPSPQKTHSLSRSWFPAYRSASSLALYP